MNYPLNGNLRNRQIKWWQHAAERVAFFFFRIEIIPFNMGARYALHDMPKRRKVVCTFLLDSWEHFWRGFDRFFSKIYYS